MTGSLDLGRWAVAACVLAAVLLLVPVGLATVGIGAILAVAGGASTRSASGPRPDGVVGQKRTDQAPSVAGQQADLAAVGPLQPVVAAAHGLLAGWSARGPLNQYAQANYRSDQSWLTWRNVDCSAAALDWLLGAYGQPLGSLDEAIALLGPGTGISTRLGLLDARGPALAQALAARGLRPRQPRRNDGELAPLGSIAELKAWLDQGPLLMDGARWFGEGHWFVGMGCDAGGIAIRDSSGWDTRYLSWSRLYGEVGFSGWVVGVVA
jgi:hypothetical protein